MLRILHLFALFYLFCLFLQAQKNQDEITFFAQIEHENQSLYAGDSCVVSIILYSNVAFLDIRCTSTPLKVKGGYAHLLSQSQRVQRRVVRNNQIYMALVWQQWMVGSDNIGKIQFSPLQFEAEFPKVKIPEDPFFRFFYGTQEVGRLKRKCKMDTYTLPVQEKPKRSTREILQSGAQVA